MKTSTATWSRPRATPRWRGCIVDVTERIRIIRRVDFTKQARIDSTYEEHGKILKAVQRKRGDQAASAARAHIETSQAEVRKSNLHQAHLARQQDSKSAA